MYNKYQAKTEFPIDINGGSELPEEFPKKSLEHLYYNLEGSGFDLVDNPIKSGDSEWYKNGYVYRFDQESIINS